MAVRVCIEHHLRRRLVNVIGLMASGDDGFRARRGCANPARAIPEIQKRILKRRS
jgi:hypothetical protein